MSLNNRLKALEDEAAENPPWYGMPIMTEYNKDTDVFSVDGVAMTASEYEAWRAAQTPGRLIVEVRTTNQPKF